MLFDLLLLELPALLATVAAVGTDPITTPGSGGGGGGKAGDRTDLDEPDECWLKLLIIGVELVGGTKMPPFFWNGNVS